MKNHETRPTGSAPLPEANMATYNDYSGGRGRGYYRGRGRGRGYGRDRYHLTLISLSSSIKNYPEHKKRAASISFGESRVVKKLKGGQNYERLLEKKRLEMKDVEDGGDDEHATNPPPVLPIPQAPHTISTIKLHILKKEGLHKGYDMFQSLLVQLEIHGASVSTEDANQKFLRSLPSFWSQVSLIMRTKPGIDTLSFNDLYNNLRVFESDVKGSTASSSSTQNVTFVSSDSTNNTNEVSTAYGVSTSSSHNSQKEGSSSYTNETIYSFFANQSNGPQLDHEDLEQVDEFDLKEMDLKWQLDLTRPKLSVSISTIQDTLLESADQKEIKKVRLMLCRKSCCNSRLSKFGFWLTCLFGKKGHRQEEGIDYDEVFAPVASIEAIMIFLAFASYMGFIVYQMDVKSSFLYGKIDEEVYVYQPPGFIDPKFPKKVYKVIKALYGLHQAPKAWYATLSTFMVQSRYRIGLIDKTLFIKKDKKDIMLVQVYVDDIIFDSTKKSWCDEFEALMKSRFHMSSMGELTFFLGLHTASTIIETKEPLVKDAEAADVDVHLYRSMIGSLMYLTAYRPDIMYAVCACSRFQVTLKTSHLYAVKRIFRYLKGQPKLGLWYPKESAFDLEAYSDSDYAGANLDRKSTTKGYVAAASCCGQVL
nr:hypothetical protein [Tanacetum cinerariifolium]